MDRVYALKNFTFVPPDFVSSLESMLFSSGELQSVMLDHCIEKINIWFANITALARPSDRYEKIALLFDEIGNSLANVRLEPKSQALQVQIIRSIIMNQVLNFSDLLGTLSFDGYELSSLALHIMVCDRLSVQVSSAKVRLSDGRILSGNDIISNSNNNSISNNSSINSSSSSSSINSSNYANNSSDFIAIDGSLVDSLLTALSMSSEASAACAVVKLREVSGEIMSVFFNEKIKVTWVIWMLFLCFRFHLLF
jgi:hypothetical protein